MTMSRLIAQVITHIVGRSSIEGELCYSSRSTIAISCLRYDDARVYDHARNSQSQSLELSSSPSLLHRILELCDHLRRVFGTKNSRSCYYHVRPSISGLVHCSF